MSSVYPKLTPLADQLEQLAQQAGVQANATHALAKIRQGQPPTTARLLIYGVPNEEERAALDQYIGQATPSVWNGQNQEMTLFLPPNDHIEIVWWEAFAPKHEPTVHALAFLAEAAKDFLTDAESHISMAAMGAPALTVVYGDPSVKPSIQAVDALSKDVIKLRVVPMSAELSLEKDVKYLHADARSLSDMLAFTALPSLKNAEELVANKFSKTQEHFTALRLQRQQDLVAVQRKSNTSATWNATRDVVSSHKEQFEKRINKTLEEEVLSPQGTAFSQINAQITALDYLDEVKQAKGKALVIPTEFMEQLKETIRKVLIDYAQNVANESKISTHFVETEVSQFLENQNMGVNTLRTHTPTSSEISRLVDRVLIFERNFEHIITAKKITEYMMGARMYYMVLMMGAGMLGLSSTISKNRTYLLPAIILILGFGVYKMVTQKTQEDEEKMDKQLTAAQDLMRNEVKRQLDNFARGWQKIMEDQYTDPVQNYIREVERQVSDARNMAQSGSGMDEKSRIQAALNSVNNQERTLSDIQRNLSSYANNFVRIRMDLVNNIKTYLSKWS